MRIGDWEIADVHVAGGLETRMRRVRSNGTHGEWQGYDRAVIAADRFLSTGRGLLEQDVWWTDREGITKAIDDLTDDHRRFIARMLIDQAAARYASRESARITSDFWAFVAWSDEHDGAPVDLEDEPGREEIRDEVRDRTAAGKHLDWMRNTALFRRMIRDLDWTHPGVTCTALDRP